MQKWKKQHWERIIWKTKERLNYRRYRGVNSAEISWFPLYDNQSINQPISQSVTGVVTCCRWPRGRPAPFPSWRWCCARSAAGRTPRPRRRTRTCRHCPAWRASCRQYLQNTSTRRVRSRARVVSIFTIIEVWVSVVTIVRMVLNLGDTLAWLGESFTDDLFVGYLEFS